MTGSRLAEIVADLRQAMEQTSAAREEALRQCRALIQCSSRAIRAFHRREPLEAAEWLEKGRAANEALRSLMVCQPGVYYAGFIHDAQKEYAEAALVGCLLQARELVGPDDLSVEPAAYLNGMAEAASEGRRYVLDRLRAGDLAEADRVLNLMDEIYYELITFDFPDALTGGLRRTTDALRAVLERTRGDVCLATMQKSLQDALDGRGRGS